MNCLFTIFRERFASRNSSVGKPRESIWSNAKSKHVATSHRHRNNASLESNLTDVSFHHTHGAKQCAPPKTLEEALKLLRRKNINETKRSNALGFCFKELRERCFVHENYSEVVELAKKLLNAGVGLDECIAIDQTSYSGRDERSILVFQKSDNQSSNPEYNNSILKMLVRCPIDEAVELIRANPDELEKIAQQYNNNPNHFSPLHLAAQFGPPEIVDTLVEHGFYLDQRDECGELPLEIAARDNKRETIVTLLKWTGEMYKEMYAQKPKVYPVTQEHEELLRKVLENIKQNKNIGEEWNAKLNCLYGNLAKIRQDRVTDSPVAVQHSAEEKAESDKPKMIIPPPRNTSWSGDQFTQHLNQLDNQWHHLIVLKTLEEALKLLRSENINETERSNALGFCLHSLEFLGCEKNYHKFVKFAKELLENGENGESGVGLDECFDMQASRLEHKYLFDPKCNSILKMLAACPEIEAAHLLASRDGELKKIAGKYENHDYLPSPLHLAAQYGIPETVNLLLSAGFPLNQKDENGHLPLVLAASWNDPKMVKMLCEYSYHKYSDNYNRTDMGRLLSQALNAANKRENIGESENEKIKKNIIRILEEYKKLFGFEW